MFSTNKSFTYGIPSRINKKMYRFLLIIGLISTMISVYSCGGTDSDLLVSGGRSLEIRVTLPEIVNTVEFADATGARRLISPKSTNMQLVVVNVTVVNRSSTVIPVLVDDQAAQIGDRRGDRIYALNAYTEAKIVDSAEPNNPNQDKYSPILHGEIELSKDYKASGRMVFEVPKGLKLGSFWWKDVDSVVIDYSDYLD